MINMLKKNLKKFKEWLFLRASTYDFNESIGYKKYIVGFKIIENRGDTHTGEWELQGTKESIVRNSINIKFKSAINYDQDWTVELYYLDLNF